MKSGSAVLVGAAACLAGFVGVAAFVEGPRGGFTSDGSGTTLAAFDTTGGLAAAIERAGTEGKPVLALATATWCPPCNVLKDETLTDPDVAAFIGEHAVAVALYHGTSRDDIRSLRVRAYPTTLVLEDGEVVGKLEGNPGKRAYMRFLRAHLSADAVAAR